jgi:hypothetical protein
MTKKSKKSEKSKKSKNKSPVPMASERISKSKIVNGDLREHRTIINPKLGEVTGLPINGKMLLKFQDVCSLRFLEKAKRVSTYKKRLQKKQKRKKVIFVRLH